MDPPRSLGGWSSVFSFSPPGGPILLLNRRLEPVVQRYVELADFAPDWLDQGGHDVRRAAARLEGLQRSVAALQERGRIAQDQLAALTSEETNQRLMVLSVLTAILLPPTLVTGFFGMNTSGLPGTASASGTWWAVGAMLLAAGLAVLVLVRLELLQWRARQHRK
ncbi:CorA family divalent cation transporter [Roseomonas elaeocarpi]|uniref:CorA family divalent cation transporter n=1 Tax=Roseomonas elaeocarpi TaxID=907779 RepID=A0ABV6JMH3_9PROT